MISLCEDLGHLEASSTEITWAKNSSPTPNLL